MTQILDKGTTTADPESKNEPSKDESVDINLEKDVTFPDK